MHGLDAYLTVAILSFEGLVGVELPDREAATARQPAKRVGEPRRRMAGRSELAMERLCIRIHEIASGSL
jgi:hypothetical protein